MRDIVERVLKLMREPTTPQLDRVFREIAETPSGRVLLRQFLPLLECGKVSVLDLARMDEGLTPEELPSRFTRAGAFFFDGMSRKIFLDFALPEMVLAPQLVHEVTHCLDEEFVRSYFLLEKLTDELRRESHRLAVVIAARMGRQASELVLGDCRPEEAKQLVALKQRARQACEKRLLTAENKAYQAQWRWIAERTLTCAEAGRVIKEYEAQGFLLSQKMTESEIADFYGLKNAS